MKMVTLKIEDDYFDKIISFLKILPKKAVTIEENNINEKSSKIKLKQIEQDIVSSFDDIKQDRTKTIRTIT